MFILLNFSMIMFFEIIDLVFGEISIEIACLCIFQHLFVKHDSTKCTLFTYIYLNSIMENVHII